MPEWNFSTQNRETSPQPLCARQIASWGLRELRPEDGKPGYPIAGIPSLQRGLVWKPAQTELLWDSLLRGLPIGAFVLCPKLTGQKTGGEEEPDEDTHHLLDGQQRAHAIALGFEDPFSGEERQDSKPILWLDLKPPKLKGTRSFLVRLTTQAHPWGYAADDSASPLEITKIRDSLKQCGCWDSNNDKSLKRPPPRECWPKDASAPVPFSWLVKAHATEDFWGTIKENVQDHQRKYNVTWAWNAVEFLEKEPRDSSYLACVVKGIQRALAAQIVCLELRKEVLEDLTPQESGQPPDQQNAGSQENIANVEHLFHRLNAGGTRLEGDELAYSMIKAYWPR